MWWVGPGRPGVLIVHGAGSGKDSHADFAEVLAGRGITALALDLRGHGDSGGATDAGTLDDVIAGLDELADRGAAPLGLRGSSLGGFLALHAAVRHRAVAAVVAICPAQPDGLARRRGFGWALDMPLLPAVARDDGVARGYWHATGDELVPWQWSLTLASHTPHPRKLRVVLGGSHTSLQHDPGVQADTADFLAEHLG